MTGEDDRGRGTSTAMLSQQDFDSEYAQQFTFMQTMS